jgi:hypothetical protein
MAVSNALIVIHINTGNVSVTELWIFQDMVMFNVEIVPNQLKMTMEQSVLVPVKFMN